jgi:hypothetical protein
MGFHGKWDDYDITFMTTMTIKQGKFKCIKYIKYINKRDELFDVPTFYTKFLNMTRFNTKLKAFAMSNWRTI